MKPSEFKTWEDICAALGIDPVASLAFADDLLDEDKAAQLAFYKLSKLSKASYEGNEPDWSNEDEYKYSPYFDMDDEAAGFGFSRTDCGYWGTLTHVGSRLVYPTRDMAAHAGQQFIDWYRDLMVLPKTATEDAKS